MALAVLAVLVVVEVVPSVEVAEVAEVAVAEPRPSSIKPDFAIDANTITNPKNLYNT